MSVVDLAWQVTGAASLVLGGVVGFTIRQAIGRADARREHGRRIR